MFYIWDYITRTEVCQYKIEHIFVTNVCFFICAVLLYSYKALKEEGNTGFYHVKGKN